MKRRDFIQTVLAAGALSSVSLPALAKKAAAKNAKKTEPVPGPWQTLEIKTNIDTSSETPGSIWLPVPQASSTYQELLSSSWKGNFSKITLRREPVYGAQVLHAEWEKPGAMTVEYVAEVRIRDRNLPELAGPADRELYLKGSDHVPTDGLARETAFKIVGTETNPDRKARKIYDWIVDNTFRDPTVRGCGEGDVASLLASGAIGGKCADLSSLFVALCRASGVPAREVFGLRVLPSEISKSLGKAGDVSKAQHCRAEFVASDNRWFPVDPADVRKVILEEKLEVKSARAKEIREKLFGHWEMNWIAFNSARDFKLPGMKSEEVNYLMYPLLIAGPARKDGMEPDTFKYTINAKEEKSEA